MEYVLHDTTNLDLVTLTRELEDALRRPIAISLIGNILHVHCSENDNQKKIKTIIDNHLSEESKTVRENLEKDQLAVVMRNKAYREEADGLFFKAQAGECSIDDWKAKRQEIKKRFPKTDVKPTRKKRVSK